MKVSEDRFPLLFFYLEGQEDELDVRTRTVTRGAAEIIGRWPQYLTFASYMSLVGLLSLVVCFILSVFVLSLTSSGTHNPKRFSIAKCESKEGGIELSRLFEKQIDGANATFFVGSGSDAVACAVESYLSWTRLPVYYIHLASPDSSANLTLLREFERKFDNYKTVVVRADKFLRDVAGLDAESRSPTWLAFLVRVVLLWNFGGTVIDANVVTSSSFEDVLRGGDGSGLVIGSCHDENLLISSRDVCHAFAFDLIKYLASEEGSAGKASQVAVIDAVYSEFCSHGRNCTSIRLLSDPVFCDADSASEVCVFLRAKKGNQTDALWRRVCPVTKFFS